MLIQSCIDFNIQACVLDGDEHAPCRGVAHEFTLGKLTDADAVYAFGKDKDLVTIEIENVNVDALERLEREGVTVRPTPAVIRVVQDKRIQKRFYRDHGIPTADFVLTENREDTRKHADFLPAVHKLGREGYDGRGVRKLPDAAALDEAFDAPGVLEKLIDFEKEISIIVTRNDQDQVAVHPPIEMVMNPEFNLVEYLFAPANISAEVEAKAGEIAVRLARELKYIGVLAVEMFLTREGEVLVNEIAPRPHNSGHHTIKANYTSQYEQHLRAILDLELGSTRTKRTCAMINLLGEPDFSGPAIFEGIHEALGIEGVYIQLYGKKETRPFRKMGHITILDDNQAGLKEKVDRVRGLVKVKA